MSRQIPPDPAIALSTCSRNLLKFLFGGSIKHVGLAQNLFLLWRPGRLVFLDFEPLDFGRLEEA